MGWVNGQPIPNLLISIIVHLLVLKVSETLPQASNSANFVAFLKTKTKNTIIFNFKLDCKVWIKLGCDQRLNQASLRIVQGDPKRL